MDTTPPVSESYRFQPFLCLLHIIPFHLHPPRPYHHPRPLTHQQLQLSRHTLHIALHTPHTRSDQRATTPIVEVHGQRVAASTSDSEWDGSGSGGWLVVRWWEWGERLEAEWCCWVVAIGEWEAAMGWTEAPQLRVGQGGGTRGGWGRGGGGGSEKGGRGGGGRGRG